MRRSFFACAASFALLAGCVHAPVAPLPGTGTAPQPLADATTFHVLYDFKGKPDGARPEAKLVALDGNFYGTTLKGGAYDLGTVFEVQPNGAERVLHSFPSDKNDGKSPSAGLITRNGLLYGVTSEGGANKSGTVFAIKKDGAERVLYSFTPAVGSAPEADLTAVGGVFYGTASRGGAHDRGTVFSLAPDGHASALHSFGGKSDGAIPLAGLDILDGNFYGTTFSGGSKGKGTIFEIASDGAEHVLYSFTSENGDGAEPSGKLTTLKGSLYGTTFRGGKMCCGTIFEAKPGGNVKILRALSRNDGNYPQAGLNALNGLLYGAAGRGGTNNGGTVFEMDPNGAFRVLHNFNLGGGSEPWASVISTNRKLYGTTRFGGLHRAGLVYEITP